MIKMRNVTIMFAMMGAITSSAHGQITININTNNNRQAISPYIYGYNGCPAGARNLTFCRSGGNRLTAYNWENNYSNAGSDWQFQNDNGLDSSTAPGDAIATFINATQNAGATALITVPIVDYVAGDAAGPVPSSQYQSLTRFKANKMRKGSAFSLTPDPNDGFVYQDEFVNWIKTNFASREAQNKFVFYSLDNEPDLWSSTHPEVHTAPVTYAELVSRTIAAASAIKDNATANSLVFGPVSYGYYGYTTLQGASDANGRDFLNFYLDSMSQAQVTAGKRLVDVLDLHWYPEAQGGGVRITGDDTSAAVVAARLQAPRSLWDPTYNETSWIQSSINGPIQLIPMLKGKIAAHYPGTKLAFTEYNYGAGGDISGGIAQADVLGIFGQQGVFAANMWPLSAVTYIDAAFNMYQDPAGNGTKVGDTSVSTVDSDTVNTSAYGFVNSANANEVDAVVINKTASPMTTTVQITNPTSLTSVKVYQLTSASASPQAAGTFAVQNNQYQYTMPAYSVSTLVFTGTGSNPAPTVTLSANPASITSGQSSTLTWSSTSATSCTGTGFTVSGTSGSVSVSPTSNTTYSITCTGSGGSASANATVNVTTTTPPALQVTPNTNISASGTQGGPFSPSSFSYTLRTASGNVKYSITTPSWLTASSTSGTVTTSAKTITFTVNSKARSLGPSTYVNNIGFNNTTSNQGSTTRLATLTVNPKQHTITVGASPSADGTVSGGGTFAEGSSHTVIAAPNGGHSFVHWTENGRVVSTSESYTFTLKGNVTLVADFR
jgi:hypothetical protein